VLSKIIQFSTTAYSPSVWTLNFGLKAPITIYNTWPDHGGDVPAQYKIYMFSQKIMATARFPCILQWSLVFMWFCIFRIKGSEEFFLLEPRDPSVAWLRASLRELLLAPRGSGGRNPPGLYQHVTNTFLLYFMELLAYLITCRLWHPGYGKRTGGGCGSGMRINYHTQA
jgi:hypothetical protein